MSSLPGFSSHWWWRQLQTQPRLLKTAAWSNGEESVEWQFRHSSKWHSKIILYPNYQNKYSGMRCPCRLVPRLSPKLGRRESLRMRLVSLTNQQNALQCINKTLNCSSYVSSYTLNWSFSGRLCQSWLQFTNSHSNCFFYICGTLPYYQKVWLLIVLAGLLIEGGVYMYFVGYTHLCATCTTIRGRLYHFASCSQLCMWLLFEGSVYLRAVSNWRNLYSRTLNGKIKEVDLSNKN